MMATNHHYRQRRASNPGHNPHDTPRQSEPELTRHLCRQRSTELIYRPCGVSWGGGDTMSHHASKSRRPIAEAAARPVRPG